MFSFCSPFLLLLVPFSFLSPLWFSFFVCFFFSSFVFFLSVSSLPPRSVFVFCVRLPLASFLSLLSSLSCYSFFLSFFRLPRLPFPPTLLCSSPSFFGFLLFFFSLFPLSTFFSSPSFLFFLFLPSFLLPLFFFLFSLLLSGPTIFSSSFFFWFFSYFFSSSFPPLSPVSSFPSVLISCLFLSLAYSSSFTPPFFLFLSLFSLGLVSLSVIICSFFRFPFASFCVLVFRFFLLPFSFCIFACFYVLPVCQSFFVSLGFSLPFSPSASLLQQLVFLRGSSVVCWWFAFSGISLLTILPNPLPPLVAFAIFVFLSSAPVSLRFLSSFPFRFLASCCCIGYLSFSFSCLFSVLGATDTGLPLTLVPI